MKRWVFARPVVHDRDARPGPAPSLPAPSIPSDRSGVRWSVGGKFLRTDEGGRPGALRSQFSGRNQTVTATTEMTPIRVLDDDIPALTGPVWPTTHC